MPKFFTEKENIKDVVILNGEDARHMGRVLRMAPGDEITVCDGEGTDYMCRIENIDKESVTAAVLGKEPCPAELPCKITLYQCIPKAGKMDSVIQKATELGASEIVPVLSKYCVAKGEKAERWQKIAYEAAKQCKRGIIPIVRNTVSFEEAVLEMSKKDISFMPYEAATDGKITVSGDEKTVGFIIGPEGGFSEDEVEKAENAGIKICTLGKRILRTETAGSAVLAVLAYFFEK